MLTTTISFLAVIAVLILAHELGHFFTARAAGVKVLEFGLGFPPRLFGLKRGETLYSLNAIPLGGFVKLAGEEDPGIPGSLAGKSIPVRLGVLAAGSIMNFLLPVLLLSIAFMIPHNEISGQVTVEEVAPGSPASLAGIVPGDILLEANGHALNSVGDLYRNLQINLGREVDLLVRHADNTTVTTGVLARWKPPEGEGATGMLVSTLNATVVRRGYPVWQAIPTGIISSLETLVLFKNGIFSMIIGTAPVGITGPVGIAQMTGEVVKAGISPLLEFAAFLSINLAIINIFPLPALDGGRMAFVLVEWFRRGKRIAPKTEAYIHMAGFLTFIVFMLLVTYQDIIRIASGQSLIP